MIGSFAYVDWPPYGLIPCKVIDGDPTVYPCPWWRVKVTKMQGPCRCGEVMTLSPSSIVPRNRRPRP
jgi:hypothetical protein